jgi:hypothetical protein
MAISCVDKGSSFRLRLLPSAFVAAAQLPLPAVEQAYRQIRWISARLFLCFCDQRANFLRARSENRMRLTLEIIEITRAALPASKPLFIRISATDSHAAGEKNEQGEWISWGVEQSKVLLAESIKRGVDCMDVSSSGNDSKQVLKLGPGYQVSFPGVYRSDGSWLTSVPSKGSPRRAASRIYEAGSSHSYLEARPVALPRSLPHFLPPFYLSSAADLDCPHSVGLITTGTQAEEILQAGKADVVRYSSLTDSSLQTDCIDLLQQITVAREFSRHADLVFDWAMELNTVVNVPAQYQRSYTRML